MNYHSPVLLKESIDALAIKEDGVYVDVTKAGYKENSKAVFNKLGSRKRKKTIPKKIDNQLKLFT